MPDQFKNMDPLYKRICRRLSKKQKVSYRIQNKKQIWQ